MITIVEDMLRGKFELETSASLHIERAHCTLAPQLPEKAPPLSIVVKRIKEEILRSAKEEEISLAGQESK